jgi:predicted AlkP superfamily pyrophosphatase or phosphodiesterase
MLPARRYWAGALALALLLFLWGLAAPTPSDRPRLTVLLVFDQLRGDYLERWHDLLGEGGFRRLTSEGAWFRNCHYPYSDTFTGAGHASLVTGCSPWRHGVIGNEWWDRTRHELVNCVEGDRYEPVPPRPAQRGKRPRGVTPESLLAPTVGDALLEATAGKARVVSLSFKDRSAALLGGHHPSACYWLDGTTGRFETSTYYRPAVHRWIDDANRAGVADHWLGSVWERLRPDLDYARYSGPDDVQGEGFPRLAGRTFPHPLGGRPGAPGSYYSALYASPFGNELLAEVVRRAVVGMDLGRGSAPDLLCVSFSSNDAVGHAWGPDSQEVLDTFLRTDVLVSGLLDFLDERVGKGRYTVVVTADHGVCPLPEVSRGRGRQAWRLLPGQLQRGAEDHLRAKFGGDSRERWIEGKAEGWFWLDLDTLTRHGLARDEVEKELATWLGAQRGIQAALTRSELLLGKDNGPLIRSVQQSFFPPRSGDVVVVPRPYSIVWGQTSGTTHGTPHPYDAHVPLVVAGPAVRPGVRTTAVTPLAAAAIMAQALGIRPPEGAQAAVPDGLFAQKGEETPSAAPGRDR